MNQTQPDYFKDRHLPVFSVDPKDRKVISRLKWYGLFLSINSFFWWIFAIIGIWLTAVGGSYLREFAGQSDIRSLYNFHCELGVGIFFLCMFAICFTLAIIMHYRVTKDAEILKKYDDNFDNAIMVKFFWLAKEKPTKCTWGMIAFGFIMDINIYADAKEILKRPYLTSEQEHQWQLEWVKKYAYKHHVTLHHVEDEDIDPWSDDPAKDPK